MAEVKDFLLDLDFEGNHYSGVITPSEELGNDGMPVYSSAGKPYHLLLAWVTPIDVGAAAFYQKSISSKGDSGARSNPF